MSKVYNSIGSLAAIKAHLRLHNVVEFKSIRELINFQKSYNGIHQQIISDHSLLIEREQNTLREEVARLTELIQTKKSQIEHQLQLELDGLRQRLEKLTATHINFFQKLVSYPQTAILRQRIRERESNFSLNIASSEMGLTELVTEKNNRYQYLLSHFEKAVEASGSSELSALARKRRIIDEVNPFIYGAFGEQKVVRELQRLSDEYILINNFNCLFDPPIYNRQEDDYIASVQIDHLLVSPAGIFLIETKNWSEHSINNLSLRSPVQQVKRASFALFRILETDIRHTKLSLGRHHWGNRKVPIKSLIVLMNQKPTQEFQYVKVLTLKELVSYVRYFKPSFSSEEVELLSNYLLSRNGQITDISRV
jgi:hypothetical protein